MSARTMVLAALVLSAAGCADGKSTVNVTVDSATAIAGIDHLRVNVTDPAGRKAMELDTPVEGGAIPPAVPISLRFDKSIRGMVNVAVDAMPASGVPLASGAGTVDVRPSTVATLSIALKQGGQATQLAFMAQPTDVAIGASIKPAVQIAVEDPSGALVGDSTAAVTIALGADPGNGMLGGIVTENAVGGVATFADLSINATGDGYTLVASADMVASATSTPFNVKPAAWVTANNGLYGGVVDSMVLDPKHPSTLYTGTDAGGVWKTTNGGATWMTSSVGLPVRKAVVALAIDPVTTTTLYATVAQDGVYKTTNGGSTWSLSTSMVQATARTILGIDPVHPQTIYASAFRTVYRSSDGGATWATLPATVTYGPGPTSIAINPQSGEVWIAMYGDGIQHMAYGSSALTLVTAAALPNGHGSCCYFSAVGLDPYNPDRVYASGDSFTPAMYRSTDDGTTWTAINTSPPIATAFAGFVVSGGGSKMYAATAMGVYSSTDGNTWQSANGALNANIRAMAVDPVTNGLLYAGTDSGIFRTTNGFTWSVSETGFTADPVSMLEINPSSPNTLYVGMGNAGELRSTDAAITWSPPAPAGAIAGGVSDLAVDETDPQLVWAVSGAGLSRSTDGGSTWVTATTGISGAAARSVAASSMSGMFYTASNGNAYVITSGASSWSPAGSGLPPYDIPALIVDPTSSMTVWAGTLGGGVFKTVNGGAAWSAVITGLSSLQVSSLGIDRTTPTTLYAGTDQGVFKTTDGASWSASSNGLSSMAVTALRVSRSNPQIIFVGTYANGVFRSADGGATWSADSVGLGSQAVTALAIDPKNPLVVYVGTYDGGVFKTAP